MEKLSCQFPFSRFFFPELFPSTVLPYEDPTRPLHHISRPSFFSFHPPFFFMTRARSSPQDGALPFCPLFVPRAGNSPGSPRRNNEGIQRHPSRAVLANPFFPSSPFQKYHSGLPIRFSFFPEFDRGFSSLSQRTLIQRLIF